MHGGGVYLDEDWCVVHVPGARERGDQVPQDVYRFVYEHRKIELLSHRLPEAGDAQVHGAVPGSLQSTRR